MKTVYLHGQLGKRFGKKWEIAASTPIEIVQAIEANTDGFLEYICKKANQGENYVLLRKDPKKITSEKEVSDSLVSQSETQIQYKNKEIHIVSQAHGGFVAAIVGSVFAAGSLAATIATSVIWGAITQVAMNALFKPPKPPARGTPTTTKSFLLSGSSTRQAQGIAVPLGYGRLRVGPANVALRKVSKVTKQSNNTQSLESYSEMEFVDLIAEGPIEGFVNKYGSLLPRSNIDEGIFLNEIQLRSTENASYNYILNESSIPPSFKDGSSIDQTIISDSVFAVTEYDNIMYGAAPYWIRGGGGNHSSVSTAIKGGAKILSHTVSNSSVTKITVSFKSELSIQNDDGSTSPNSLRFSILMGRYNDDYNVLDPSSGCTINFDSNAGLSKKINGYNSYFVLSGIATGTYQFDINISYNPELNSSEISGGINFKFIKMSSEYDPSVKGGEVGGIAKSRLLQLGYVLETIDEKMLYPHSAMCKLLIDGKNFSSPPDRSYHVKLKKVLIPSNYDPVSRKYNGPWNGLFKGQTDAAQSINEIADTNKYWTDNPAWVFFDLLHNPRYGIGKYGLEEKNIDKWQLYKVSKYCDELVETDYPIETQTSLPRPFRSTGNYREGNFEVFLDSYSDEEFKKEFGNYTTYSGKRVAFFVYQHNFGSGNLSSSQISTIKENSKKRIGEITIEERALVSAHVDSKKIILRGPNFGDNASAFGSSNTVCGACACQVNHPIVEPRFTSNLILTDRSEALQIIDSMTSVFRGMATYVGGKISATQDSYKNPIALFNNSNVIGGEFNYSGTHKNKKTTAALVRFNNKDKNFKPDLVYEEDASSMQSLGYVENETMGFGITSESQARRLAKWILMTSQLETESIKFKVGQEGSYLMPGSVFEISDESRTNQDKSGRVMDVQLYRNRLYEDENNSFIETSSPVYDPYILIDKENTSTATHSRVEITIYSGQGNETFDDIERRAPAEKNIEDQDLEIDSMRTPQILRFEGSIHSDPSIDNYGTQGQKTIVSDLALKLPIEISLSGNLIKIYNHGLSNGQRLYFTTDGILPGGIETSNSGLSNYYVINSTKHTFQISTSSSGSAVNIFSMGKDRFKNEGGLHYAVINDSNKINDALDQINLGAAYSIKGLIGTRSDYTITETESQKLGLLANVYPGGWVKSDFLGMLLIKGDWAYVYGLGWTYIKHLKERQDGESYWFYVQDMGWIWTNSTYRDKVWMVDNTNYSTSSKWLYVLYKNSSKEKITGFFAYDSSALSAPIRNGSKYVVGKSRKMTIHSRNSHGYFVSNDSRFSYYNTPLDQVNISVDGNSPNYKTARIVEMKAISDSQSVQGQSSIRVEIESGHGLNLDVNGLVSVVGSGSTAEGEWSIVKLDDDIFELVNSSSIASGFSTVTQGSITLTESLRSVVDRYLEGQLFRTVSVKEVSENQYEVTGLEYNYSKFFAIDSKGAVRTPSLPIPPQADMSIPEAPDGLLLFDLTV